MLRQYQDCFSGMSGKLHTKVHLEIDPSVPPVVHPPRENTNYSPRTSPRKLLKEMDEDGIIVKEEEHSPWVSSMPVVDKRKAKDKGMNIPPSKDNVKHQRD